MLGIKGLCGSPPKAEFIPRMLFLLYLGRGIRGHLGSSLAHPPTAKTNLV